MKRLLALISTFFSKSEEFVLTFFGGEVNTVEVFIELRGQ